VNLVTYNQEPFIRESIRSVLNQTLSDLELVIVDDGSADATAEAVAEFNDRRIVYIRQENQGPGAAANRGCAASSGVYIATMTGDDLCHPDRLEVQLEAHRKSGGVIFSNVDFIDEAGNPVEGCTHYPKDFFLHPPMTQAQILERFFRSGNFINTVTIFTETENMRSARFDPALYQTHDYDALIQLVKRQPFTILPRSTLSYRLRHNNTNLSAPSPQKVVRCTNEWYLTLRRFFDNLSPDLFKEAFRSHFVYPQSCTAIELACERAFLYLNHPSFPLAHLIGVEQLHSLLSQPRAEEVLRKHFRFTIKDFIALLMRFDILKQLPRFEMSLLVDTGKGFNAEECIDSYGNHSQDNFEVRYDLSHFSNIQQVYWEPARFQLCRLKLDRIFWIDSKGGEYDVDFSHIDGNGLLVGEREFEFPYIDPHIVFPMSAEARQLVLKGKWTTTDIPRSAMTLNRRLQVEIPKKDAEIAALHQQLHRTNADFESRLAESSLQGEMLRHELHLHKLHLQSIVNSRSWRWLNRFRSLVRSCLTFRPWKTRR
jgi:glycosyltransferase involved in cell wall biosynthesis